MRPAAPILAAFVPLAVPTALLAQEVVGTISGTIDGTPASWSVQDGPERETGWQDTDTGFAVTLDAFPEATPPTEDELLRITFATAGTARDPVIDTAEASLATPDGTLQASGQNVDMTLTTVEVEGDSLVLSGNVVATIVPGGSDELLINPENGSTIDGNFQATVLRAE